MRTLRSALGVRTRRIIAGVDDHPAYLSIPGDPGDIGLFGPDSAAWRAHSDTSILIGGIRALLLQTLHPLAMAGVADHSDYRDDPLGRLHRTADFLGRTVFGSTPVAEQAITKVRAIHEHVKGIAPDGRPYRADDPHLLTWVHITEVQSFLVAHQSYGRDGLDAVDADRYVHEMAQIGLGLGMTDAPHSVAELDALFDEYRPELVATPQTHDAIRFLRNPPLPLPARPAYALMMAAATGLLDADLRRQLQLRLPSSIHSLIIRPAATVVVRTLGWALGDSPAQIAARERALATH